MLEAAPGAGKTTRVPAWLMDRVDGDVLVLEPRRLAARLAARRIASERGERVGDSVGYHVRFEEFTSAQTRLRFLTEGVLNRRLATDSRLSRVAAVVLDEFHERHLEGDLALALLLHLQRTARPDLRLYVMSATLDAAPIAAHLDHAPILRSEGRLFPLEVRYTPESAHKLEEKVADTIDLACRERPSGDILVFLPGAAEIRRSIDATQSAARRHDLLLAPLYGDLSPEEQDIAVTPATRRKVIFATNIAESSITIEGVSIVIDSGLARVATDSRSTGLPSLSLGKISHASAIQRAGRAARTAPGLCVRLYTEQDFLSRPERGTPEILSRELSGLLLQLRAMDIPDPLTLPWLTPPAPEDLSRATRLLDELGAHGPTARRMAGMPVHPRLARLLLEAESRRVVRPAARTAALLSGGERPTTIDLLHATERGLNSYTERIARQLERQVDARAEAKDPDRALAESLLAAYPDRVARRRRDDDYEMAGGLSARLGSPWPKAPEWLCAVDVDELPDRNTVLIRAACPIEPDWLIELFPNSIAEIDRYTWSRQNERVERESALTFHGLPLDRSLDPSPRTPAASALLLEKVREAGWRKFLDVESTELLLARVAFANEHGFPVPLTEADLVTLLETLTDGRNRFSELRDAVQNGEWQYRLDQHFGTAKSLLDRLAPERLALPAGRQVRVHYAPGQTPHIASRLQDFWGLKETPRIAGGQVPVLVHLLAPNQRPVQMTQDLASFWAKLYPELRTQLSRRYPKHQWP